ncbi:MAG: leucine-rich repeat protein, partial [Roseburia sp.]|nr:leucine-rich repeat protein [Roseburia sp.]
GKQGPWTDIYALGATLYYALTLDLLDDPMSRLEDDSEYSSNAHNIDAPLWEVIRKATMLKSSERYRDIRELQEALEALPVRPEPLPMSEASVDKVKYEPAAQTVHGLSGMAETVGYVEAGGATVPVSGTAGATMPLREEQNVGATMPVSESVGATQALREETGVTMPVSEPGPVAQGQSAESISSGEKDKAAEEPHRETGGIQTSATEEPPAKKKKINRKLFGGIAAGVGVLAVVLLIWLVRSLTADFRYETYSDHVVITEYKGDDTEVEIPSEINGKPVTEIGENAFWKYNRLRNVEIPDSVTEIGEMAFGYCTGLRSVEIPDSVTEIGLGAFGYCVSLGSVKLPNSLTEISEEMFWGCDSLTSVAIPESVTKIDDKAFGGCTGLTSVEIPESVTEIGEKAFSGCTGLTSVTLPAHTAVAENAFENCPNVTITRAGSDDEEADPEATSASAFDYLIKDGEVTITGYIGQETDIVIPREIEGCPVTRIDENAFSGCDSLTSVILPDSVTRIGAWAFCDCSGLTAVILPESLTQIGEWAFDGCSSLTSITIPDSVVMLEGYTFDNCPNLTEVTVSEHTEINEYAFGNSANVTVIWAGAPSSDRGPEGADSGATPLSSFEYTIKDKKAVIIGYTGLETDVVIPREIEGCPVREIEGSAFWGKFHVKSVVIPDSVTRIGSWAFMNCDAMVSITIPDGVKTIEEHAFSNCSSLTSVVIPDSVTEIGEEAFIGSGLTEITIPAHTAVAENAFGTYGKNRVTIITPWEAMPVSEFKYTITDGKVTITEYSEKELDVVVPREIEGCLVTAIGDTAFYLCRDITSVVIPDSVTMIDYGAFWDCNSLTRIVIPNSVTSIGMSAFVWCSSLKSVVIPDSVMEIGEHAFDGCPELTDVIIPEHTVVAENAFENSPNVIVTRVHSTAAMMP